MPPKSHTPTAPPAAAAAPATAAGGGSRCDGVEAELSNAAHAIAKVESKIDAVENEIEQVKEVLKAKGGQSQEQAVYLGMNVQELKEHLKALNEHLKALNEHLKAHMREKEQLREEKAKLMDKQAKLSPDVPGACTIGGVAVGGERDISLADVLSEVRRLADALRPGEIKRAASSMSTVAMGQVLERLHRTHCYSGIPCTCYEGPRLAALSTPAPYEWVMKETAPEEVTKCQVWLQRHIAPPGVCVVAVQSQEWLTASWPAVNVILSGSKTDFMFLPRDVAETLPAKPGRDQLLGVLPAILGFYETKTSNKLKEKGALHAWPQAAAQHLTVNELANFKDYRIPVFAGDLNMHLIIHSWWDEAQPCLALHVSNHSQDASDEAKAAAVAYMCALLQQRLQSVRPSGAAGGSTAGGGGGSGGGSEHGSNRRSKRPRRGAGGGDHGDHLGAVASKGSGGTQHTQASDNQQTASCSDSLVEALCTEEVELHHHRALVSILARPEGYEAIGLPGPPHTVQHSSVKDWLSSWEVVANSATGMPQV